MPTEPEKTEKKKPDKKQLAMFIIGLVFIAAGVSILGFFAVRKAVRYFRRLKLMRENYVIEMPEIGIQAPVLEGTDNAVLRQAAGHFPDTGSFGSGNYCIAAHSSPIYKEYFNPLKNAKTGMEIRLYNVEKDCVTYSVSEMQYVQPNETWVLEDFGDDRITLITCNDDGSERLVVVGLRSADSPAE